MRTRVLARLPGRAHTGAGGHAHAHKHTHPGTHPPTRTRARITTLTLTAALALVACDAPEPVDLPEPAQFEQQVLDEINAIRLAQNKPRLTNSPCMADHARVRAEKLPGAVEPPRDDLPADCGDFGYAGENVSRSEQNAAQVVSTWATDELQRPNLVDEGFTHAGVGCVGVSFADSIRVAEPGAELAGMACSVIFQGPTASTDQP